MSTKDTERTPETDKVHERTARFDEFVLVKVTEAGEEMWNKHYSWIRDLYNDPSLSPLERDEDGYTRMRLIDVAHIFGPDLFLRPTGPEPRPFPIEPDFKFVEPTKPETAPY